MYSGPLFSTAGTLACPLARLSLPRFGVSGWMLYLDRRRRQVRSRLQMLLRAVTQPR